MTTFIDQLKIALDGNSGKIPVQFIQAHLHDPRTVVTHIRPTPNTRVCVITLTTGHDLVGYAQVLDEKNDIELVGQSVAYDNAAEEIWRVFGAVAKVI